MERFYITNRQEKIVLAKIQEEGSMHQKLSSTELKTSLFKSVWFTIILFGIITNINML